LLKNPTYFRIFIAVSTANYFKIGGHKFSRLILMSIPSRSWWENYEIIAMLNIIAVSILQLLLAKGGKIKK